LVREITHVGIIIKRDELYDKAILVVKILDDVKTIIVSIVFLRKLDRARVKVIDVYLKNLN